MAEPRISISSERRPSSNLSRPAVVERQPALSDAPVLKYKRFSGFGQLCANLNLRGTTQSENNRLRKKRAGSMPLPVVHENWIGEESQRRMKRCDSEPMKPSPYLFGLSQVEQSSDVETEAADPPKKHRPHSSPTPYSLSTPMAPWTLSTPSISMVTPARRASAPLTVPPRAFAEEQVAPHGRVGPSKHSHTRSRAVSYSPLLRSLLVAQQDTAEPLSSRRPSSSHRLSKQVSFSEVDEVICSPEGMTVDNERGSWPVQQQASL